MAMMDSNNSVCSPGKEVLGSPGHGDSERSHLQILSWVHLDGRRHLERTLEQAAVLRSWVPLHGRSSTWCPQCRYSSKKCSSVSGRAPAIEAQGSVQPCCTRPLPSVGHTAIPCT